MSKDKIQNIVFVPHTLLYSPFDLFVYSLNMHILLLVTDRLITVHLTVIYFDSMYKHWTDTRHTNSQLSCTVLFTSIQYEYADIAWRDVKNAISYFKDLRPSQDSFSRSMLYITDFYL